MTAKKVRGIALAAVLSLCTLFFTGCGNSPVESVPADAGEQATQEPEDTDMSTDSDRYSWDGYFGTLTRRDSSQYSNAVMQVKGLGGSVVLFEFDIMEGSESEDNAGTFIIAGTMLTDDKGAGLYEGLNEDGTTAYSISFNRSEDGMLITVSHTGDLPMNPDGEYDWVDNDIESDAQLAMALLENLPTAATSLNSNIGAYTINYPEACVLNYFYPVTATFDDTGATLAEYLVCSDLSAVWRLDTEDGIPALIYGTAQDMLDAVVYLATPESESGDDEAQVSPEAIPLLDVMLEGSILMEPGASAKIVIDSPYPFASSLGQPLSSNEEVATVSEDGTVTAHQPGTTTIMADIVVEDGSRGFMLDITVGTEGELIEAEPEAAQDAENGSK